MDTEKALMQLNASCKNTLMQTLDIVYTFVGDGEVHATMPVNPSVHQPMGLLHGGASVALAESVGSAASHLYVPDPVNTEIRGIEISANHVKSKRDGIVTAKAKIIHRGRTTHLWEIRIEDEEAKLISLCKLTNIVLPKK